MKKLKFIFAGVIMSAIFFTSCSKENDQTNVEQPQAATAVLKTAKMVSFESALKDWYQSKAENNSNKSSVQINLEIENQATSLLKEIGVSQTDIDAEKAISNDMLVYFALEQYSNKLSQMYNQKQRAR
ncbi:hypothetical protein [Flavobacterium sp.]|uniref:hypothetical protein n=1 Tax=Flavobacterium sp. TaxID=239 RepID=UPI0037508DA4